MIDQVRPSDDSKPSQLMYLNLTDDEQARLEIHENKISTLLLTMLDVRGGGRWVGIDDVGHREIRLDVPGHEPETVFRVSAMDLAEMSPAELISEITHTIKQI